MPTERSKSIYMSMSGTSRCVSVALGNGMKISMSVTGFVFRSLTIGAEADTVYTNAYCRVICPGNLC